MCNVIKITEIKKIEAREKSKLKYNEKTKHIQLTLYYALISTNKIIKMSAYLYRHLFRRRHSLTPQDPVSAYILIEIPSHVQTIRTRWFCLRYIGLLYHQMRKSEWVDIGALYTSKSVCFERQNFN